MTATSFPGFGGFTGGASGPALAEGGTTGDFVFGGRSATDFTRIAGVVAVAVGFIALVYAAKS